jgi:hypothetical protein
LCNRCEKEEECEECGAKVHVIINENV